MSTVESYLRQQYALARSGPSMESGMGGIFGTFELPSLYTPQTIPRGPWNDPDASRKYTVDFLRKARYREQADRFQTPKGSWLWQAGKPLTFDQLIKSIDAEMVTYVNLLDTAWPIIRDYTRWALRTTMAIETISLDDALSLRPKSVAEIMSSLELCLMGQADRRRITVTVPFKDDILTTLKIQQRPDLEAYNYILQLDGDKAIKLLEMVKQLDFLVSKIDDKFSYFEKSNAQLKTFRELVKTDEPDHPIYKFLDSEMMGAFNQDLHCALFNRASSISNHLRMQIYCSAD